MTYSLKLFLSIHWDFSLQGVIQTRVYSMDFAELVVFIECFSMSLNVTGVYNLVARRSCSDGFNFSCSTSVILGYQGVFLPIFRNPRKAPKVRHCKPNVSTFQALVSASPVIDRIDSYTLFFSMVRS